MKKIILCIATMFLMQLNAGLEVKEIKTFKKLRGASSQSEVRSVAFSKNSKNLFFLLSNGECFGWNIENGQTVIKFKFDDLGRFNCQLIPDKNFVSLFHHTESGCATYNPKNKITAYESGNGIVKVVDLDENEKTFKNPQFFPGGCQSQVSSLALSDKILAVGFSRKVIFWNIEHETLLVSFEACNSENHIKTMAFSPDGQFFATGSESGEVNLYQLKDQKNEDNEEFEEAYKGLRYLNL